MAAELCPQCNETALVNEGGFCPGCGWDAELMGANYRGDDAELPEDDADYDAFLAREGLGDKQEPSPLVWLVVVGVITLGLIALVVGKGVS